MNPLKIKPEKTGLLDCLADIQKGSYPPVSKGGDWPPTHGRSSLLIASSLIATALAAERNFAGTTEDVIRRSRTHA